MKIPVLKCTVSEINSLLDGVNSILKMVEERVTEPEVRSNKNISNLKNRKKEKI